MWYQYRDYAMFDFLLAYCLVFPVNVHKKVSNSVLTNKKYITIIYLNDILMGANCMLDFIIIGMVFDDDLTGYDIKKYIENGIGVFYKASYGSLYPALKKLTEKGYLNMYEKPQGGRQKNYYKITDEGKEYFLNWLVSPMNVLDGTNAHLAKVYFFDRLPQNIRDRQLLEHEMNNTNYLWKLKTLEKEFISMENKDYYYKLSTLYYGIYITQATIQWCQHIRSGEPLSDLIQQEE